MRIAKNGSAGFTTQHLLLIRSLIPQDKTLCWEWQGALDEDGYGIIGVKQKLTHRLSYEFFVGPINGMNVCHSCDNPKCINPGHLWLGTHADNARDKTEKGRCSRKGRASLSVEDAISACSDMASGMSRPDAAEKYGICIATASHIKNRRTWHFR